MCQLDKARNAVYISFILTRLVILPKHIYIYIMFPDDCALARKSRRHQSPQIWAKYQLAERWWRMCDITRVASLVDCMTNDFCIASWLSSDNCLQCWRRVEGLLKVGVISRRHISARAVEASLHEMTSGNIWHNVLVTLLHVNLYILYLSRRRGICFVANSRVISKRAIHEEVASI